MRHIDTFPSFFCRDLGRKAKPSRVVRKRGLCSFYNKTGTDSDWKKETFSVRIEVCLTLSFILSQVNASEVSLALILTIQIGLPFVQAFFDHLDASFRLAHVLSATTRDQNECRTAFTICVWDPAGMVKTAPTLIHRLTST